MTINNFYIPDAGKIFKFNNALTFKVPASETNYEVLDIDVNNISINSSYAYVDNKFCVKLNTPKGLKGQLINMIFSNDDEIAILLNHQQSKTAENKQKLDLLQNWRNWCGNLVKLIQTKLSNSNE